MISERDIIYITKKQASLSVAALATFCLLIFMLGYFWGKQSVLNGLGQKVAQDSMQDQVDYLQTMQSFVEKTNIDKTKSDDLKEEKDDLPEETKVVADELKTDQDFQDSDLIKKEEKPEISTTAHKKISKKYSATLLGFGSKSAAMAFINRLKKHNITVVLKRRLSKSASGKSKRSWYQIVTKLYDSKKQVQDEIDRIKKFERIKDSDISIV